ncbi:MAG: 1-deoxy-D-xylulose-5-phosphate synthase [Oscillospiraceae bacterium]|nr:1-deoxy-D-xylulose-5-phosphate synthase [Oscillospiraceae bacterium]
MENIRASNDVKKLRPEELEPLCAELRAFLIQSVAKTGGHLSSNLGAVELTVALHRVYDSSKDRIVFDVGHQSYIHKILTGRREAFSTLRQFGGLSGFPKPYEAEDDAFIAGHASDSVSVALGMARARTLKREKYDVVAVIGDGAMTGGLAYEGLTNAAASGEPLVVILNDNKMSIGENVGGVASLLQAMRTKPGYLSFKRWYREVFSRLPALYRFNHRLKEWLKSWLLPENMFREMGFYYLGPVDGHDVNKLETVIRWARDAGVPVLLHVVTKKGKGCPYAEKWPETYHGVGPFDPDTGAVVPAKESFSTVFGETLCELAAEDERVCAITAAMAAGTGLEPFAERFPKRFFDVGIAEGHGVSMAAGMAKQGLIPVFGVYSSFLQRGYDMLLHDVGLQKLHVVLAADRAGLVGSDGETHHGLFDIDYLSAVPGMSIYCPASFAELRAMLRTAVLEETGPAAVRYPRGGEGLYTGCGEGEESLLCAGKDLTLVCCGTMVNEMLEAAELLSAEGVSAELVKINRVQPCAFRLCLTSARRTGRLLIAEEVCRQGSVGTRLLALAEKEGIALRAAALDLGEGVVTHGSAAELRHCCGLDAEGIVRCARTLLNEGAER